MKQLPFKRTIAFAFFVFLIFSACGEHMSDPGPGTVTNVEAPEDFDFDNRQTVRIVFRALSSAGTPIDLVRCNVYRSREDRENSANHLMQGFTDDQGTFATEVPVSAGIDSVYLKFNYVGAINQAESATRTGDLTFVLGQGINGKRPSLNSDERSETRWGFAKDEDGPPFRILGTWDKDGLPDYLDTRVSISEGELDTVNQVIPQGVKIYKEFPQYFADGVQTNVNLLIDTPVYLTFLHQDTGQKNVFCYFTYPTASPPTSVEEIDSLTIVFPHAHFNAGLEVGDRVKLGDFEAGTSIGFAVIRNGWAKDKALLKDDDRVPTYGEYVFYSIDELNPSDEGVSQHFIIVNDADYNFRNTKDRLLMSCEDNHLKSSDPNNNWDDLIFYITGDDNAFETPDMPVPPILPDCDNDGVPDYQDVFPCDENRALQIIWEWETIAFDDDWPDAGDLDYNDLIVATRYVITCDWDNLITDVVAQIVPTAMGTTRENGYGFSLPILPSDVTSTSGYYLTGGYINLNANGTEAGQSKATFIAFDNGLDLMPPPASGIGVNTERAYPYVEPDTLTMQVIFNRRFTGEELGWPPYDPFIIIDQNRGREVHLNNVEPSALVDASLLGTADDVSDIATGLYYRTSNNIPWGLHIPIIWEWNSSTGEWDNPPWAHPFEGELVYDAYFYFDDWLTSGGADFTDWYNNYDWNSNDNLIYFPFGDAKK